MTNFLRVLNKPGLIIILISAVDITNGSVSYVKWLQIMCLFSGLLYNVLYAHSSLHFKLI